MVPQGPLFDFVVAHIEALRGTPLRAPVLRAEALDSAESVIRYTELGSRIQVVGKFYGKKWYPERRDAEADAMRRILMAQEASHLATLRAAGFDRPPHEVVRPLGCAPELDALLLLANAPGQTLTEVIRQGLLGQRDEWFDAVGRVARFLADLHARTAQRGAADPAEVLGYLDKVAEQVAQAGTVGDGGAALRTMGERWMLRGWLDGGRAFIHGDATPANFMVAPTVVTAIDGERIRVGDPLLDVGCLVAELKHLCFLWTGDPWAGEPLIERFYRCYAVQGTLPFDDLTARGRAYMALYLLRIARNDWLSHDYRTRLVEEAMAVGG